ncbi:hypothetical protein MNBD_DELTA01-304 [hydrothermal vent metagenome]|uniref:Uncharacterized protein n=1 Tax=hydrothermal vent metagenome TaxID=652676 RepID=A0A3B0QSY6_9ZZZZ
MKKFLLLIVAVAFISLPVIANAGKDDLNAQAMPQPPAYKSRGELTAEIKRLEAIPGKRSWQEDFTLGVAYMHAGRTGQALVLLEKTVKERPSFEKAYESLGMARFKDGDMEGALRAWKRAVKADNKAVHLKRMIVVARDRLVIAAKVDALLREVDGGKKKGWQAHLELARLYLKLRKPGKSLIHVNKAIGIKGEDVTLLEVRGRAYAGAGEYGQAAVAFRKAHALSPEASPDKRRLRRMLADMEHFLRRAEERKKAPAK